MMRTKLVWVALVVLLVAAITYGPHLRRSEAGRARAQGHTSECLAQLLSRKLPDNPSVLGCIEAFPSSVAPEDEITLVFLLVNLGADPITVDGRIGQHTHLFIRIHDSAGRWVDPRDIHATLVEPTKEDFIVLRSGQMLAATLTTSPRRWSRHSPDTYAIAVECALYPEDVMPSSLVGAVLSNTVAVTVRSR